MSGSKKKTDNQKKIGKHKAASDSLAKGGTKFKLKYQLKKDKESRKKEAARRESARMRATGRKELAPNYGKFKGEKKKKN